MTTTLCCLGEALIDAVSRDGVTAEVAGGSLLNVAAGLAALDHDVRLVSAWGRDPHGRMLAQWCATRGIAVDPLTATAPATTIAHAEVDAAGHATYRFTGGWQLSHTPDLDGVAHLHVGSYAATLAPGAVHVGEAVRGFSGTVSYDPNIRSALMGSPAAVIATVEGLVAASDVVKASDEDLGWLYPATPLDEVARAWLALGPALVVLTRAGAGMTAYLPNVAPFSLPAPPVGAVVDTVGAGDAFMAGLLSGLTDAGFLGGRAEAGRLRQITREQVEPACERALGAAAVSLTHTGAYAPTRGELHLV